MQRKIISAEVYRLSLFGKTYAVERLQGTLNPSPKTLFMHLQSFSDLETFKPFLPYIHGLEIKPDGFKDADALFGWNSRQEFSYNADNFDRLAEFAASNGQRFQFHFPFKKIAGVRLDTGLRTDHERLLEVFGVYAQVIAKYGFGPNITIHPPEVADHRDTAQVEKALYTANTLYYRLGKLIDQNQWPLLIGIENQPDPLINNYPLDALGYRLNHFETILRNTNDKIQLTIDSGHRNLASDISVTKLITLARSIDKHIINFHFHENDGIDPAITASGESCDAHKLATPGKVHGFTNYLIRSVLEDIPLNLEIKTKLYEPLELLQYVSGLNCTLQYIYEQISSNF